jgi:hypothetical protein
MDSLGSVPAEERDFLYSTGSIPALGPTEHSIQRVTRALILGIKRPGREADQSSPFSAEVYIDGTMPPLPHTSLWHVAWLIKNRDNLIIIIIINHPWTTFLP